MTTQMFVAVMLGFCLLSGCGYGQYQTARTEPKGKVRLTVAQNYQTNENAGEQGEWLLFHFPQQLDIRVGVADRVDLGLSIFLMGGAILDTKVNLMPPDHDFALAVRLGFGGASVGYINEAWLLHLPVAVIASYRFLGCLSPYVGFGYGFFWIFGKELPNSMLPDDPNTKLADREGYGDGVLRLTVGIEWMLNVRFGLLLEYSFLPAVVDDPGDNFSFVDNHIVGLGMRF